MCNHHYRHSSSSVLSNVDSWVVLTDDKSTFIGWHPEREFPYEYTRFFVMMRNPLEVKMYLRMAVKKPLPQLKQELKEGDSVLKIQYQLEEKNRFQPDGPTDKELQKLTYTTKHRWSKTPEKKYRKPNPPCDREGI
ncbi:mitochondrial ribosomal protein L42 isoform X3 [Tachypleus tridentatus]